MNFLNSRSNNFLDKGQKAGIIAIALAELCKGSTPDSDSVCEGSNPSSAAKNNSHPSGWLLFFVRREVSNHVCRPPMWLSSTSSKTGRFLYFFLRPLQQKEMQANPSSAAKQKHLAFQPGAFCFKEGGFESCPKATYVACMNQRKHWRIPLFGFPVPRKGKPNASESFLRCQRSPSNPCDLKDFSCFMYFGAYVQAAFCQAF